MERLWEGAGMSDVDRRAVPPEGRKYDLLLKGGRVIDPSSNWDGNADVAILGGRIAAVAENIPPEASTDVVDVTGKLVVPGLVDLHAHVYPGVTPELGVEADRDCLAKGTTTVVDAGSAGAFNIDGFRRFIVKPARSRIMAFLNISRIGMPSVGISLPELAWLSLVDIRAAVDAIQANRDLVRGLKVRASNYVVREAGMEPFHRALQAADEAGVPLMVHIGDSPMPLGALLDLLRPGDIVTHTYNSFAGLEVLDGGRSWRRLPDRSFGTGTTILDETGQVIPQARAARRRGVIFDVGHGGGSFSFDVFERAMAQSFPPDVISSDVSVFSINGPVYDLPTVLSRFLGLGLTLSEVLEAATIRPARILGMAGEIGTLAPGAVADVAVLDLLQGEFTYTDGAGQTRPGHHKLSAYVTLRGGELIWPTSSDAVM